MEGFVKGQIVVIDFPFSDLSDSKRRPAVVLSGSDIEISGAVVLSDNGGDDIILCQVTSQNIKDKYAIEIDNKNFTSFEKGKKLTSISNVRPNKIFTFSKTRIKYSIGKLNTDKTNEIIDKLIDILKK